jgi:hypothetical protein
MNEQITDHLARLRENPLDSESIEALVELYLDASTTNNQRASIHQTTANTQKIYQALWEWEPPNKTENPERYLRLRLAALSMADGWPNPRAVPTHVNELAAFARGHGIDPAPHLQALAAISTRRFRELLHGRVDMKRWLA